MKILTTLAAIFVSSFFSFSLSAQDFISKPKPTFAESGGGFVGATDGGGFVGAASGGGFVGVISGGGFVGDFSNPEDLSSLESLREALKNTPISDLYLKKEDFEEIKLELDKKPLRLKRDTSDIRYNKISEDFKKLLLKSEDGSHAIIEEAIDSSLETSGELIIDEDEVAIEIAE